MKKVLLVDDEPIFRMGLRTVIPWADHGYQIVGEAKNGEEALLFIAEKHPDIVFLDIKMPKIDGIEVLKRRSGYKDNPYFVVLSCFNEYVYVREAMKLGACDYLFKPLMEGRDIIAVLQEIEEKLDDAYTGNEVEKKNKISACIRCFLDGTGDETELLSLCPQFSEQPFYMLAVKIPGRSCTSQKKQSLLTLCREVLARCFDNEEQPFFVEKEEILYGLFFFEGEVSQNEYKRRQLLKKIKEYVETTVWVASSLIHQGIKELPEAVAEVSSSMAAHFFSCYGGNKEEFVFYSSQFEESYDLELNYKDELLQIQHSYGIGDIETINHSLQNICQSIIEKKQWNSYDFSHMLADIVINNLRFYKQRDILELLVAEKYNVLSDFYHQESMEETCVYLISLLERIFVMAGTGGIKRILT